MNFYDGATFADTPRLDAQMDRIRELMFDGKWRTLNDISETTGDPPASISAQLRHLRKDRFGGYNVEKQYVGDGLYLYRVADFAE
jgi:hypothetical protein